MKRHPNHKCVGCGKPFYIRPNVLKKITTGGICRQCWRPWNREHNTKYMHTPEAKTKSFRFPKGDLNPSWKGGLTYRRRKGKYGLVKYVRCPLEFISMARKDGYVMEHRLVMAQSIGRPLMRVECVHHINHLTLDNRLENLMLFAT